MFNITSPMADFLYSVFNIGLIGGALLVLGSTIGTVWTGGVKERYSSERVSMNEAETARANEAAAAANRQTAQLRVDLERERLERTKLQVSLSSRHLTSEQIDALRDGFTDTFGLPTEILFQVVASDQEAQSYGQEIEDAISNLVQLRISSVLVSGPSEIGIHINGPQSKTISSIFQNSSIPISDDAEGLYQQNRIFIGPKPRAD